MKPRRGLLRPRFIDEDIEAQGLRYFTRVTQAGLDPESLKSQSSWGAGFLASATDNGREGSLLLGHCSEGLSCIFSNMADSCVGCRVLWAGIGTPEFLG